LLDFSSLSHLLSFVLSSDKNIDFKLSKHTISFLAREILRLGVIV